MRDMIIKEGVVILLSVIAMVFLVGVCVAQAPSSGSDVASPTAVNPLSNLSLGRIFIYLLVMLGPDKLLVPFTNITRLMGEAAARSLAVKGFAIACAAGLVAAIVGRTIIASWRISLPALLVAAGLVLLLVALQRVMAQYQQRAATPAETEEVASEASTLVAMTPLAFPNIITPYGTAVLILLLSAAAPGYAVAIFGVFVAVMIINLITMIFARPILKYGAGILAVFGSVLGVLQVALAVQMLLLAGQMIGLLPPLTESTK